MSSSSRANDTLPDTAYGSSSGFSEYLSRMEWLILDRLTCPMVQPPKRRSAGNELYGHIQRDPRHKSVELLHYEEIAERRFGGWTMGQVNLSKIINSILL